MNYYKLLKINNLIKNPRLKLLGLMTFHVLKKRYISVQFDPVNACIYVVKCVILQTKIM